MRKWAQTNKNRPSRKQPNNPTHYGLMRQLRSMEPTFKLDIHTRVKFLRFCCTFCASSMTSANACNMHSYNHLMKLKLSQLGHSECTQSYRHLGRSVHIAMYKNDYTSQLWNNLDYKLTPLTSIILFIFRW